MKAYFYLFVVVLALITFRADSGKLDKNVVKSSDKSINLNKIEKLSDNSVDVEELSGGKPAIILSEALNFFSSIIKLFQTRLNLTDSNSTLLSIFSNPIFNGVSQSLNQSFTEATNLINDIESLLADSDASGSVNDRIRGLISELNQKIKSLLGRLISAQKQIPISGSIILNNVVMQALAAYQLMLGSVGIGGPVQPKSIGLNLPFNKLCSTLQDLPKLTELETLTTLFAGNPEFITQALTSIANILMPGSENAANSTNSTNTRFVIPLTTEKISDFEQTSYGLSDNNKLVITTITTRNFTKRQSRNIQNDLNEKSFFHQMSLYSLQSMMSSLVNDMKDGTKKQYLNALECQIDSLGCSLRQKDNGKELQNCINKLIACVGKGLPVSTFKI